MILFHYTTKSGYDSIISSKTINPSDPWTTMDAYYGTGWYFTDLEPKNCDLFIAMACWKTEKALPRVEYCLKFDIDPLILESGRKHVFFLKNWDEKLIKYLGGEKVQDCNKKPCLECEDGEKVINSFKN
jgi:hypothetical protein